METLSHKQTVIQPSASEILSFRNNGHVKIKNVFSKDEIQGWEPKITRAYWNLPTRTSKTISSRGCQGLPSENPGPVALPRFYIETKQPLLPRKNLSRNNRGPLCGPSE